MNWQRIALCLRISDLKASPGSAATEGRAGRRSWAGPGTPWHTRHAPLLQEHHLVDVVACKAVGRRDEHSVHLMSFDDVAQTVEARGRASTAPLKPLSRNPWAGFSAHPSAACVPTWATRRPSCYSWFGARPGDWSKRGCRSLCAWDGSGRIGGAGASAGADGSGVAHCRRS
jgi:hypothetical protein